MKNNTPGGAGVSNDIELEFLPEISQGTIERSSVESGSAVVMESGGLSAAQLRAVELLASGQSVPDVAAAVGVGRATVYRWLKADPAFVAAYSAWQQEVVERARGRLLSMSTLAVGAIEKALERDDEKVAISVLQKLGVLKGTSGR